MAIVREPAVAGMFYPSDPDELQGVLAQMLDAAAPPDQPAPKAIIAPHAGYIYSGPVAASVYALLSPARGRITRVVLMGPSHRVPLLGIATSSADFFHTPLGDVPVDRSGVELIEELPQVKRLDAAHQMEHSLEVHLPFLQQVLGDFSLIPLVVGESRPTETAEVIERLWGGEETLFVISSDLSHYHDYARAKSLDEETRAAIERLDPDGIDFEGACGRNPVAGLLLVARHKGLHPHTLDLRNSGDTAGSRDSVVGYGAWAFR